MVKHEYDNREDSSVEPNMELSPTNFNVKMAKQAKASREE